MILINVPFLYYQRPLSLWSVLRHDIVTIPFSLIDYMLIYKKNFKCRGEFPLHPPLNNQITQIIKLPKLPPSSYAITNHPR